MYLYLDLIWLLNFFIDFLLLWMTGHFRKLKINIWRIGAAAALGSSYVLLLFLPTLDTYYTFLIKIILSLILVSVALGFGNIQRFANAYLMFYFVSFVTGGGIFALHFLLRSQHEVMQGMIATQSSGYGDPVSWLFVVFGFAGMYWFTKSRWHQIETTKTKEGVLAELEIYFGTEKVTCRGLIDTGNQLYDPISKTPVMMLNLDRVRELVPQQILVFLERQEYDAWSSAGADVCDEWAQRLRVIPFRGVRQGMEIMTAIKPDRVVLNYEGQKIESPNVFIGLNREPLSREGQYEAILHPAQLQSQQKEEAM